MSRRAGQLMGSMSPAELAGMRQRAMAAARGAGAGDLIQPESCVRQTKIPFDRVDVPRNWLLQRGLSAECLAGVEDEIDVYECGLDKGLTLLFCGAFFCVRRGAEIVDVQLVADGTEGVPDTPMAAEKADEPYSVNMQGYLVGSKGVSETALREQLMASAATMARLLENANAGRRHSEAALQIHRAIKTSFVEVPNYRYELGQPSHTWTGNVAGIEPRHLLTVINEAQAIMQKEPTLLRIDPPVYVIGDLHGNFKDFAFFAKRFGLWDSAEFVPARFLFLGDYVDRGFHSIETIAFVLALKVRFPDKVFLLRGNHECAEINGDTELYMSGSFKTQLKLTYGIRDGEELWRAFNRCFDYMPLAAVLDNKIFCVHAGLPRFLSREPNCDILSTIAAIQRPPMITDDLVFDLIWSDPATVAEERYCSREGFPPGFGPNSRGPATCVFGKEAVRRFCENSGCSHLIRAHQSPKLGVDIAKNATILTVFSSSHYCGGYNHAASVLVHDHKLDIILSNPEKGETDVFGANDDYRVRK